MSPEQICDILEKKFGEAIVRTALDSSHPHAVVAADRWPEVAVFLKDDPRMGFNLLRCLSALDLLEDNKLAAIYDLHAMIAPGNDKHDGFYELRHRFAVRIEVDRDDPQIPSVADLWPAANWHEREAYDLMGIHFTGHPDTVTDHDGTHPRRILCPDDWEGHPLRKDYLFPMEYHGIPGTTEYQLTSPKH